MPAGSEEYRGHEINWDIAPAPQARLWKAQASIVLPLDASGVSNVYTLAGPFDRFQTEAEAREHVIRAAKEWIDKQHGRA